MNFGELIETYSRWNFTQNTYQIVSASGPLWTTKNFELECTSLAPPKSSHFGRNWNSSIHLSQNSNVEISTFIKKNNFFCYLRYFAVLTFKIFNPQIWFIRKLQGTHALTLILFEKMLICQTEYALKWIFTHYTPQNFGQNHFCLFGRVV